MRPRLATQGLTAAVRPNATERPKPWGHEAGAEAPAKPNTRAVGEPNRSSFPFGAPPCRIVQRTPSLMQGSRRSKGWELVFELLGRRAIEPLMGWTATNDPFTQIRLRFPTLAAAVAYAEREGLDYSVVEPPARRTGSRVRYPIPMPGVAVAAHSTGYPSRPSMPGGR